MVATLSARTERAALETRGDQEDLYQEWKRKTSKDT
jgi:hypothetical protein